jgi:hypothetical protein
MLRWCGGGRKGEKAWSLFWCIIFGVGHWGENVGMIWGAEGMLKGVFLDILFLFVGRVDGICIVYDCIKIERVGLFNNSNKYVKKSSTFVGDEEGSFWGLQEFWRSLCRE